MSDASDVSDTQSSNSHPGRPRGQPVHSVDADDVIEAIERPRESADDRYHVGRLPQLDLPSFGEPDDDCGDPIPQSMYFCPECSTVHEKPHTCYRYDCPLHWPHAVRRRVSGSKSAAGLAPQLDALRRYLYSSDDSDDDWIYHHLVFSLGKDRKLAAKEPLKRELETVREIMDALGIQGVVAFHPWAGDNEDHDEDDRGKWKNRIGKDTEWDEIAEDLEARPHWHIIGVAPYIDMECTPQIYEETGAVLTRITTGDSNKSITRRKDEDTDDNAMVRALTYSLSHAGIYETESGQRRLAAWMKGPDVHRISPLEKNVPRIRSIVYEESQDTLGIQPPNMECDEDLGDDRDGRDDGADEFSRPERSSPIVDVWDRPATDAEQSIGARMTEAAVDPDQPASPPTPASPDPDLPARDTGFNSWASRSAGAGSSSSSSSRSRAPPESDDVQDDVDVECGGKLRHISQAGEFLLDGDWNEEHDDEAVENVETAYRSYVEFMTAKGLDPVDDRATVPEFADGRDPEVDGPPPG